MTTKICLHCRTEPTTSPTASYCKKCQKALRSPPKVGRVQSPYMVHKEGL